MPKKKDLKRVVRSRMRKTGENYTTARGQVVQKKTKAASDADLDVTAGMSSASVAAKTGKTWMQWVRALDASGARSKPHREIARWLQDEHGVPGWWAQTVTVGYERIRGLRDKGQRRGGGFDVNKSKTVGVTLPVLYRAFDASRRKRWLRGGSFRVKKATPEKSMRLAWSDGTSVEIYFWAKGESKSQVQVQHRGLESKAAAAAVREQWTERLAALTQYLADD